MRWRRFIPVLAVLFATLLSLVGVTKWARAAPAATYSVPKEGPKVTLVDNSIDGPAIIATYAPATALAWTGTDPAHHLNVLTSSDGLHYNHKLILPETSLWRPALAFIDSGRGAPYGTLVIAWTGTDVGHTLNVEFISLPSYTVTQKITYWGDTSFTAPALMTVNGDINSDVYLGWSGNDPGHSLNVIHYTTVDKTTAKVTLWGWTSISRPNLATDHSTSGMTPLLMSWLGSDNHLYFATSADGKTWNKQPRMSQMSAWAPTMIGLYSTDTPTHWVTWTGSGSTSTRAINVMYTQHFPSWSDPGAAAVLPEAALAGPALAYNGVTHQVLVAWTGLDAYHSLNVAVVYVAAG